MLFYISIMLLTAFLMEFVSWGTHKFVMHGPLWSWHEDHHNPDMKKGFFEKNDFFFILFAVPSMACYFLGSFTDYRILLFIGIGISIYGLIYFLIHDVYIHRRFKWFKQLDSTYSRAILRAHGDHHVRQDKDEGTSFGLLIVNPKYFKKRTAWAKNKK